MGRVRILRADDVRASIDMRACIDACESAFVAYSSGGAELPGVIHLDVPESRGEIHVKAGHLHGALNSGRWLRWGRRRFLAFAALVSGK